MFLPSPHFRYRVYRPAENSTQEEWRLGVLRAMRWDLQRLQEFHAKRVRKACSRDIQVGLTTAFSLPRVSMCVRRHDLYWGGGALA